ncbi:M20/M25/M40 family metallo-hydrolase [Flavihumibacter sp. R14]|nr:M20/M25/M40 family metallo-hydrolase [Flavihumibacter soli]
MFRNLYFKATTLCLALLIIATSGRAQNADSIMIRKIYDEALDKGHAYRNLEYLCKKIGPRLSGSAGAQKSVEWTKKLMEDYGFDTVYLQEVMVPHWERGVKETAFILDGNNKITVPVAALGSSIATPQKGITAQVIEVRSLDELKNLGENTVKGKIVFFNRPFNPKPIETFDAYRGAVDQRGQGAIEAAKLGAVAVIVRSMTHALDDYPHTGGMRYADNVTKIPAAAISTNGAELLSRKLKESKAGSVQFYLKQDCRTLPDALSYNVIGEMRGSSDPEEIISVGGHLDSWDLAEGAHDDGTGVMQSVEVLRIFKSMNYKPKRTLRAVMFMNEENGLRGGLKYAELAKAGNEKHIAAIESDAGGFTPRGFSVDSSKDALAGMSQNWLPLLKPYLIEDIKAGGGGADIGPLRNAAPGVTLIGYRPDSQRYFDIHHASNDVFENVNRRELELGAAAMAALTYLIDQKGL